MLNSPLKRLAAWLIAISVFIGGIALFVRYYAPAPPEVVLPDRLNTALLNFDITWIREADATGEALGGSLGLHSAGIFAAQKAESGEIFFLPARTTELRALGLNLPPNNRSLIPEETPTGQIVDRGLLRYNDLAVRAAGGGEELLVSYSFYREEGRCFVNRIAAVDLPVGWLEAVEAGGDAGFGDWRVVFETDPCLPIVDGAGFPFTGHQAGGQIVISPQGEIFLSVGDFGFDGTEGKLPPYPLLDDNSYGRILELTPEGDAWTAEPVAIGLRNPQGLTLDTSGRLWETEHSAMGGDELNLIRRGANYGWPAVTVGVNYVEEDSDDKYWPFNATTGAHDGFVPPVFAWVPSIAPSNIRFVTGLSPRWDGHLLVGALKDQSIVRLQLQGDHVMVAETIEMERRVRYVEVGHGRLYVLFDQGEFAVLTPHAMTASHVDIAPLMDQVYDPDNPGAVTVVADASILVGRGCVECHSGPGTPKLNGLFERRIASQPGIQYSPALIARGGTWTEPNLRAFLADPQVFAPGSTMPKRALSENDITAIVQALKLRRDL